MSKHEMAIDERNERIAALEEACWLKDAALRAAMPFTFQSSMTGNLAPGPVYEQIKDALTYPRRKT